MKFKAIAKFCRNKLQSSKTSFTNKTFLLTVVASAFITLGTRAHAQVSGSVTKFQSPQGKTEFCVTLAPMPGAYYSPQDLQQEQFFCSIDLYAPTVALCPKTWSTSAGTMVYSTGESGLTPADYERLRCQSKEGHLKLAKHKTTMNAPKTSGTFSNSSLLYYHFSRYFDFQVDVPVTVFRTIDKDVHYDRVSSKAKGTGMNAVAWSILRAAEKDPNFYKPIDDLFTQDRQQIYGILLVDKGERYGPEFNGTRARGWGDGQNYDFQETAAFLALKNSKPLIQAMQEGLAQAQKNPAQRAALGPNVSQAQMILWMRDLIEITLLDYIFNQQDRVGNIDYDWAWYYVDGGTLKFQRDKNLKALTRTQVVKAVAPADIVAFGPVLIQRTAIGDNDAGGRVQYTNFTKRTKMLEGIRHFNSNTYRRLIALNNDLAQQGALYKHVQSVFGMSSQNFASFVGNVKLATSILKQSCASGQLQFDLDPRAFFTNSLQVEKLNCETP